MTTISTRALNRATLERQMLLRRWRLPVLEAVERLAGLQAQTVHTWYVGLWSRLDGFAAAEAAELLTARRAVRVALMRSTIHLVSARDCLEWRPLVQPVIERGMNGNFGRHLGGVDRGELVAAGRELVEQEPRTFSKLGQLLAERWPGRDQAALTQAVRAWVPLVQVPPRGVWGASGPAAHTSVEAWLGSPVVAEPSVEELCMRYLAAFGPASVKDIQTWCGLTKLGEVVERLRRWGDGLVVFRDALGRELFDLPDAPRPDPETPAPPRFLYDFDNLLLSHADRSRVAATERYPIELPRGVMPQTVLVDGVVAGFWNVSRQRGAATLTIRPFTTLSAPDVAGLAEEGARLLDFLAPDAEARDVEFSA